MYTTPKECRSLEVSACKYLPIVRFPLVYSLSLVVAYFNVPENACNRLEFLVCNFSLDNMACLRETKRQSQDVCIIVALELNSQARKAG